MQVIAGDITKRRGYICLPICKQLNRQKKAYLSRGILYYYSLIIPNLEDKVAASLTSSLLINKVGSTDRKSILLTFPIKYSIKDPYNMSLVYHSALDLKTYIGNQKDKDYIYIPYISDEISEILQKTLTEDRYIIIRDTTTKSRASKKHYYRKIINHY